MTTGDEFAPRRSELRKALEALWVYRFMIAWGAWVLLLVPLLR